MKTKPTSKCGGECLRFKCFVKNPEQITDLKIVVSTIENTDLQQGQIYFLDVDKTGDVNDAFLCRSALKENKVYVKLTNGDGKVEYDNEVITITDNICDYDVSIEVKSCNVDDICIIPPNFYAVDFFIRKNFLLINVPLHYEYNVYVCNNGIIGKVKSEGVCSTTDPLAFTFSILNYIKFSTNNIITLSYTENAIKYCYTLTPSQYQITGTASCSPILRLTKDDFTQC